MSKLAERGRQAASRKERNRRKLFKLHQTQDHRRRIRQKRRRNDGKVPRSNEKSGKTQKQKRIRARVLETRPKV